MTGAVGKIITLEETAKYLKKENPPLIRWQEKVKPPAVKIEPGKNNKVVIRTAYNQDLIKKAKKGRKDRYTLLSDYALRILREYLKKHRPSRWVFEGAMRGRRISTRTVQAIFSKGCEGTHIHSTAYTPPNSKYIRNADMDELGETANWKRRKEYGYMV